MKFSIQDPPRKFEVGLGERIEISDCGKLELGNDEQITFVSAKGTEYDVCRKEWGYYATPSLNDRLVKFKLKAVLVKGPSTKYYILLVESGRSELFERYLKVEQLQIVTWLDQTGDLEKIASSSVLNLSCICGSRDLKEMFSYDHPPVGEAPIPIPAGKTYRRRFLCCQRCDHFIGDHDFDLSAIYSEAYVNATYKDEDGIQNAFQRIVSLDPAKSDNRGRCTRIAEYASAHFGAAAGARRRVLDVGSGLGVFPFQMKQEGWVITALDPDARAAKHIEDVAKVPVICGDFMKVSVPEVFDLITFNKVLEHLRDPVPMLTRAKSFLRGDGLVYVELPDGEEASKAGKEREEFLIDHYHAFSAASISILSRKSGFVAQKIERIREPSGKYTLRAFLTLT
jgi:SAM-dependent methyltransferase